MSKRQEIPTPTIQFLNQILQKIHALTIHIDSQVNITIAISSAIFIFSATKIYENGLHVRGYLIVLGLTSALSVLAALLAIHPPSFMREKGQKESLIYHGYIAQLRSSKSYSKRLTEALKNEESLVDQYALEIYNLSKYYYRPKRILFKLSRNSLFIGFFLSLLLFILSL